jgi:hypothetical protein
MNSEEVKALLAAFDDLVDIKILIRKIVPNYELDSSLNEELLFLLNKLNQKLQPLFSKYLTQESAVKTEASKIGKKKTILEAISGEKVVLISANSSKKKLKSVGVDPRNIIVSGGPLFIEDYKVVNPNLPDKALPNIKKKCERVLNELKHEKWAGTELIFVHEKENATDKLILNKLEHISNLIQKKITTINVGSWDILDD